MHSQICEAYTQICLCIKPLCMEPPDNFFETHIFYLILLLQIYFWVVNSQNIFKMDSVLRSVMHIAESDSAESSSAVSIPPQSKVTQIYQNRSVHHTK